MEINEEKVTRLLDIIDAGLAHGGGRMRRPGDFCVQQVLAVVFCGGSELLLGVPMKGYLGVPVKGKWSYPLTDGASVGRAVSTLAIALNDQINWESPDHRAKGLRRLAVAELGSEAINQMQFLTNVAMAFAEKYPAASIRHADELLHGLGCQSMRPDALRDLANIAVDTLQQMMSPGCEFLYLCDDDKPIAEATAPAETFVPPSPFELIEGLAETVS